MVQDHNPSIFRWIMSEAIEPPRGLVIAAGGWIIFSAITSFGFQLPLHPSPSSLTPSIRMLLLTCAVGMMIAWPLVRLSQTSRDRMIIRTIIDALTLAFLWQLIIWPLRLGTPWPIERTLLLDLLGITSLTGSVGIIAAASAFQNSLARGFAMICCILLTVGLQLPLAVAGFTHVGISSLFLANIFQGGIPNLLASMNSPASMPELIEWESLVAYGIFNGALCLVGLAIGAVAAIQPSAQATQVASGRRAG